MADLTVRQAESIRLTIKAAQLVNRLQNYALSPDDGTTPDMPMGKITAGKVLLDKILPGLQSADITAHSSPQIEDESALLAKLAAIIDKYPHIISDLQRIKQLQAPPEQQSIEHTAPDDAPPEPIEQKTLTDQ